MKPKIGRKHLRKLFAALLLFPLVAACSNGGDPSTDTAAIDPPPSELEQQMVDASADPAMAPLAADTDGLTVYLQDNNGFVAPMTLRLAEETGKTKEEQALAWLTAGKTIADQLPAGFKSILPQEAAVRSVQKDEKTSTVTIDFEKSFPVIPAKEERKAVEALVWTMTELPGVKQVKFTVDGQPLRELPASKLPIDEEMSRAMGINVEQAAGLNPSRSMAVTLYFSASSADGERYFVPVTRLVDRQADKNKAAIQELIKGPLNTNALKPVIATNITVDKLAVSSDLLSLSLKDASWEPEILVPTATVQALVLTLTEVSGQSKVKLAINGSETFKDTNEQSYAEPISRPIAINALEQ